MSAPEDGIPAAEPAKRRLPRLRTIVVVALGVLLFLWVAPTVIAALGSIDIGGVERPYLLTFFFVWWDAIVPIFPSESLLNTASTLIASGDIDLDLWLMILAGGLGAVLGDSSLYWLARTVGRKYIADRLERLKGNPKIDAAFRTLGASAPLLIVGGRFVPGMRFAIGATMGLTRYPYDRFLAFSFVGGFAWAAFNCGFSYLIGSTKLGEYSVLSLLTSFLITTVILALFYRSLKARFREAQEAQVTASPAVGSGR